MREDERRKALGGNRAFSGSLEAKQTRSADALCTCLRESCVAMGGKIESIYK